MANPTGRHSPLHLRGGPTPGSGSQIRGMAPAPTPKGEGPIANADRAVRREAHRATRKLRNIGNDLLPGNPFG